MVTIWAGRLPRGGLPGAASHSAPARCARGNRRPAATIALPLPLALPWAGRFPESTIFMGLHGDFDGNLEMSGTAIGKGLRALELLAGEVGGATAREVAAKLKIPRAGAQKSLDALVARRVARKDEASGRYFLTMQVTRMGFAYLSRSGLSAVYQPILDQLAECTGELVRMAVAEGDRITWVGLAQGARSGLRIAPDTGRDVSLSATATGKAWLATFPLEHGLRLALEQGFGEADQ